ncbi:hypothetical protein RRG08_022098 [Elysia crispata]|uniref:Uncharacterized protein n=1 Tax=Elysia crispata TaxID=231223 RepID=A0AAE0Y353_9GAST|nr:hypothetical protein RRG08_022098 [Elysia crispata]
MILVAIFTGKHLGLTVFFTTNTAQQVGPHDVVVDATQSSAISPSPPSALFPPPHSSNARATKQKMTEGFSRPGAVRINYQVSGTTEVSIGSQYCLVSTTVLNASAERSSSP